MKRRPAIEHRRSRAPQRAADLLRQQAADAHAEAAMERLLRELFEQPGLDKRLTLRAMQKLMDAALGELLGSTATSCFLAYRTVQHARGAA